MFEQRLTIAEIRKWLTACNANGVRMDFAPGRQQFSAIDQTTDPWVLTLPLICPPLNGENTNDVLTQFLSHRLTVVIILIQAGYAALGYCEGDTLVHHKMVKKYMVRQSQGKSQITYKKSKGKSRLGSRIRLQNSVVFFEDINQVLHDWDVLPHCDRILMSLPVNLTNLLYSSKVSPPFKKKDTRIKKIPFNVQRPSFNELRHIHWEVSHGNLSHKGVATDVAGIRPIHGASQ